MIYIASISYGKDSLAMLEVIKQHDMPLDGIAHVELMASETIPADLPEVTEWKSYADEIILHRYGMKVEHIKPEKTFEEMFYSVPQNRLRTWAQRYAGVDKYAGQIRGFPAVKGHWCSTHIKAATMRKYFNTPGTVQYIGIAADETKRMNQLNEKIVSPLVIHGVTEAEAKVICENIGLLAPIYLQSRRSGCWFCPFQPLDQLRLLYHQHPELWQVLLRWSADSPVPFRYHRKPETVQMLDDRFKAEAYQMTMTVE